MANMKINGSLEFNTIVGNGLSAILSKIYPIGSIYMSTNSTSPASFLGGTWEQILGKFLLSSDDVLTDGTITTAGSYHIGDSGGEATHTLTVDEMPKHNHQFYQGVSSSGGTYTDNAKHLWDESGSWGQGWDARSPLFTGDDQQGVQSSGGSQAHNNMPPYLAVYMWKRTA